MPRNRRATVFLNDHEYQLIKAVQPQDISLGATIRRLACDRAQWLANKGLKSKAGQPIPQTSQTNQEHLHQTPTNDGPTFHPDPQ